MYKKYVLYLVMLLTVLFGCEDEYFPEGYWPYQVEFMLTNGDSRNWLVTRWEENGQEVDMNTCSDSLRLAFEVITSDSIASYQLRKRNDCVTFDTTFIGELTASGGEGFFTDSLYLERANGSILRTVVNDLTSKGLIMQFTESGSRVYYELGVE